MVQHRDLIRAATAILADYGVPAKIETAAADAGDDAVDATVTLEVGTERHRYDVVCKTGLRPGTIGALANRVHTHSRPCLLVTDYVSPATGERLRQLGIPFVDVAGNAWIEEPPVVIRVEGRKKPAEPTAAVRHRPFTASGVKVVFALLTDPSLFAAPTRSIAETSGTSPGTVSWVMSGLRDGGYVIETGKGRGLKRRPRKLVALLDEWAPAYARTLAPKLTLGRYAVPADAGCDWWRGVEWHTYNGATLSGEPAAALWTNYLHPGSFTIYADRLPAKLIAQMGLERDDRGSIEFRQRFWAFRWADRPNEALAPLVYADLLATDEPRCVETARMIYNQYLAQSLESY